MKDCVDNQRPGNYTTRESSKAWRFNSWCRTCKAEKCGESDAAFITFYL